MPDRTLGIILGGGRGKRLLPLTQERSKPAVPFGGKYRLVDVSISNCLNGGIRRIFVLTQFNSASLNNHISRTYRFDSFGRSFVDILAAEQTPERRDWYQGTADAVRRNLRHIMNRPGAERVLILSGDQLYRMNFRELLAHHQQVKADVTVAVTPVPRHQTERYGVLRLDRETFEVTRFVEKPAADAVEDLATGEEFLASMGIYVFDCSVLEEILSGSDTNDFGHDILPALVGKKRLCGYLFRGYFEDVGTIRTFYEANLGLTQPLPEFNFYEPLAPIYTHPRFLPGSKIDDCRIQRSLVTEGVILNQCDIHHSVVGIRSRVQRGARLTDMILMGADFYQLPFEIEADLGRGIPPIGVGEGAVIERAIVDKNARIGRGVHIAAKDGHADESGENYVVRDGIVVIPKDAVVPDGTHI
ncbi:MAG TPA: glucose-1-phosphate adenylyltransferase [Vicinamibacteria bacterium]|nr:glucose-1-phosphate adenylyltransferase [Vicinamibacteria bacterium]